MPSALQQLSVCLSDRRRYRPDSPFQNWRELGIHGTRDEIIAAYANMLELRYAQGGIRPSDLVETYDNVGDCHCRQGVPCTTEVLETFVTGKLENLTQPWISKQMEFPS